MLREAVISDLREQGRRLRCRCVDCDEYEAAHGRSAGDADAALRALAEQLNLRYGMRLFGPGGGDFDPPTTRA